MKIEEIIELLDLYYIDSNTENDIFMKKIEDKYNFSFQENEDEFIKLNLTIKSKNNFEYNFKFHIEEINIIMIGIYKKEDEYIIIQMPLNTPNYMEELLSIEIVEKKNILIMDAYTKDSLLTLEEIIKYLKNINYHNDIIQMKKLTNDTNLPNMSELIIENNDLINKILNPLNKNDQEKKLIEDYTIENIKKNYKKNLKKIDIKI